MANSGSAMRQRPQRSPARRDDGEAGDQRSQNRAENVHGVGAAGEIGIALRPAVDKHRCEITGERAEGSYAQRRAQRAVPILTRVGNARIGKNQREERGEPEPDPRARAVRRFRGAHLVAIQGRTQISGKQVKGENRGEGVDHIAEVDGEFADPHDLHCHAADPCGEEHPQHVRAGLPRDGPARDFGAGPTGGVDRETQGEHARGEQDVHRAGDIHRAAKAKQLNQNQCRHERSQHSSQDVGQIQKAERMLRVLAGDAADGGHGERKSGAHAGAPRQQSKGDPGARCQIVERRSPRQAAAGIAQQAISQRDCPWRSHRGKSDQEFEHTVQPHRQRGRAPLEALDDGASRPRADAQASHKDRQDYGHHRGGDAELRHGESQPHHFVYQAAKTGNEKEDEEPASLHGSDSGMDSGLHADAWYSTEAVVRACSHR